MLGAPRAERIDQEDGMPGWAKAARHSHLVAACIAQAAGEAEDYPTRPVRMVVGFGRAVADVIARRWRRA